MRQDWDDVDKLIMDSRRKIEVDSRYNEKLKARIFKKKEDRSQSYVGAFSLIMAGFLAIFIYTSDVQYKVADLQAKARTQVLALQYNHDRFQILKYIMGE